jgi:hypothetical protein
VVAVSSQGSVFVAGSLKAYPPHYADFDPGCEVDIHCTHTQWGTDTFITKLVCPELSADFDGNGFVDLRDVAQFQLCFTDEAPTTCSAGCSRFDLHPDDDIDLDDYTAFRKRLKGPQPRDRWMPPTPNIRTSRVP